MSQDCRTIEPGVLYGLNEASDRLGWGRHAMRSARKEGMKVIRFANRGYLLGDDIIEFFKNQSEKQSTPQA